MGMSVPGNSCRPCVSPTSTTSCTIRVPGKCVYYAGTPFSTLSINTGEDYDSILAKLVEAIGEAGPGTVTSIAATIPSGAISIAGSPITTSGTLAFTYNGTTSQYIRGDGSLATFPTTPVQGANNGLSLSGTNVQLGGTLLQNTLVDTTSSFSLTIAGSGGAIPLKVNSANNISAQFTSQTSIGIQATGGDSFPSGHFTNSTPYTSSIIDAIHVQHQANGSPASLGIGVGITMNVSNTAGLFQSTRLVSRWTDITHATRTSIFEIFGANNGTVSRKLAVAGSGQLIADAYGSGIFTGVLAYLTGVTSTGSVIEIDPTTIGSVTGANNGLSVDTNTVQLGQSVGAIGDPGRLLSNREIPMNGFSLRYEGPLGGTSLLADGGLHVERNIKIGGNINTGSSGFSLAGINFGTASDYYVNSENAVSTSAKLWLVYPKFATDTGDHNQPFYCDIGTTIYDGGWPANSVINIVKFGDDSLGRPMARLAMEQNFFDDMEFHLAFKPRGSSSEIRQISTAGDMATGQSSVIYRFDNQVTTDGLATHTYKTEGVNSIQLTPRTFIDGNVTTIALTANDFGTTTIRGGMVSTTQLVGGTSWVHNLSLYGNQVKAHSNGLFFNSISPGAEDNFGRNYIFNSISTNGGPIMWVGKDWGGTYTQAFEVQTSGNTIFGPQNTTDRGNKLQALAGSGNPLGSYIYNANNSTSEDPIAVWHTLTSGSAVAGMGVGIVHGMQLDGSRFLGTSYCRSVMADVTVGSEDADYVIYNIRAGTVTEALRSLSTGALRINNAYNITNSDGTNGQVLTTDGAGNVTFQVINSNIVGTTTNDNAVAGNIGEETNSTVSTYTNYTTSATYQNITSITLTAGDWDLSAFFTFNSNAATLTTAVDAIFVISTTSASAAGAVEGKNITYITQAAPSHLSGSITPYRVSIASTTTYYLNTQATFTVGNPQYVGSIRARRIR